MGATVSSSKARRGQEASSSVAATSAAEHSTLSFASLPKALVRAPTPCTSQHAHTPFAPRPRVCMQSKHDLDGYAAGLLQLPPAAAAAEPEAALAAHLVGWGSGQVNRFILRVQGAVAHLSASPDADPADFSTTSLDNQHPHPARGLPAFKLIKPHLAQHMTTTPLPVPLFQALITTPHRDLLSPAAHGAQASFPLRRLSAAFAASTPFSGGCGGLLPQGTPQTIEQADALHAAPLLVALIATSAASPGDRWRKLLRLLPSTSPPGSPHACSWAAFSNLVHLLLHVLHVLHLLPLALLGPRLSLLSARLHTDVRSLPGGDMAPSSSPRASTSRRSSGRSPRATATPSRPISPGEAWGALPSLSARGQAPSWGRDRSPVASRDLSASSDTGGGGKWGPEHIPTATLGSCLSAHADVAALLRAVDAVLGHIRSGVTTRSIKGAMTAYCSRLDTLGAEISAHRLHQRLDVRGPGRGSSPHAAVLVCPLTASDLQRELGGRAPAEGGASASGTLGGMGHSPLLQFLQEAAQPGSAPRGAEDLYRVMDVTAEGSYLPLLGQEAPVPTSQSAKVGARHPASTGWVSGLRKAHTGGFSVKRAWALARVPLRVLQAANALLQGAVAGSLRRDTLAAALPGQLEQVHCLRLLTRSGTPGAPVLPSGTLSLAASKAQAAKHQRASRAIADSPNLLSVIASVGGGGHRSSAVSFASLHSAATAAEGVGRVPGGAHARDGLSSLATRVVASSSHAGQSWFSPLSVVAHTAGCIPRISVKAAQDTYTSEWDLNQQLGKPCPSPSSMHPIKRMFAVRDGAALELASRKLHRAASRRAGSGARLTPLAHGKQGGPARTPSQHPLQVKTSGLSAASTTSDGVEEWVTGLSSAASTPLRRIGSTLPRLLSRTGSMSPSGVARRPPPVDTSAGQRTPAAGASSAVLGPGFVDGNVSGDDSESDDGNAAEGTGGASANPAPRSLAGWRTVMRKFPRLIHIMTQLSAVQLLAERSAAQEALKARSALRAEALEGRRRAQGATLRPSSPLRASQVAGMHRHVEAGVRQTLAKAAASASPGKLHRRRQVRPAVSTGDLNPGVRRALASVAPATLSTSTLPAPSAPDRVAAASPAKASPHKGSVRQGVQAFLPHVAGIAAQGSSASRRQRRRSRSKQAHSVSSRLLQGTLAPGLSSGAVCTRAGTRFVVREGEGGGSDGRLQRPDGSQLSVEELLAIASDDSDDAAAQALGVGEEDDGSGDEAGQGLVSSVNLRALLARELAQAAPAAPLSQDTVDAFQAWYASGQAGPIDGTSPAHAATQAYPVDPEASPQVMKCALVGFLRHQRRRKQLQTKRRVLTKLSSFSALLAPSAARAARASPDKIQPADVDADGGAPPSPHLPQTTDGPAPQRDKRSRRQPMRAAQPMPRTRLMQQLKSAAGTYCQSGEKLSVSFEQSGGSEDISGGMLPVASAQAFVAAADARRSGQGAAAGGLPPSPKTPKTPKPDPSWSTPGPASHFKSPFTGLRDGPSGRGRDDTFSVSSSSASDTTSSATPSQDTGGMSIAAQPAARGSVASPTPIASMAAFLQRVHSSDSPDMGTLLSAFDLDGPVEAADTPPPARPLPPVSPTPASGTPSQVAAVRRMLQASRDRRHLAATL